MKLDDDALAGASALHDFDDETGLQLPSPWDEGDIYVTRAEEAWPFDSARGGGALGPDGPWCASWAEAEAKAARPLVEAAAAFARLDERLHAMAPEHARAAVERLAVAQATDLLRAEGVAVGPDGLALDAVGRTGRLGDDPTALARGLWATRRLTAASWSLSSAGGLAAFEARVVAREPAGDEEEEGRLSGFWSDPADRLAATITAGSRAAAVEAWFEAVRGLEGAHPVTRAAFAEVAWRRVGLSPAGTLLESSVAAMKLAACAGRGGAPFAPLPRRRRRADPGEDPLGPFCADLREAASAAVATLTRLQSWRVAAGGAIVDLSGRTPLALVDALARRPMLTAVQAARIARVSVASVHRNLAILVERGVARELTGQGRFRLWAARLP